MSGKASDRSQHLTGVLRYNGRYRGREKRWQTLDGGSSMDISMEGKEARSIWRMQLTRYRLNRDPAEDESNNGVRRRQFN